MIGSRMRSDLLEKAREALQRQEQEQGPKEHVSRQFVEKILKEAQQGKKVGLMAGGWAAPSQTGISGQPLQTGVGGQIANPILIDDFVESVETVVQDEMNEKIEALEKRVDGLAALVETMMRMILEQAKPAKTAEVEEGYKD